jgi:hypothetical protein
MTESPFASSRCYLSESSVHRCLGRRYPALLAYGLMRPTFVLWNPRWWATNSSLCRLL